MAGKENAIRIAVRAFEPFETALEKIWDKYCQKTGCDLHLQAIAMDLHELHSEILEQEGLKKGTWDIAYMNTDWIAEAYSSDAIENLKPYIEKAPPEDFPGGWSDSLLKMQIFDGDIFGLPFHDGPECLIYRKDLFEDPEEQARYKKKFGEPLQIPKTWEDFQKTARFFQRPEEDLYGSVFAAYPDGHNTIFDFCLQLWTRGGELVDEEGNINFDNDAALEGLTYYRNILNDESAIHPNCGEFDSVKSGTAFANGEVAMMVNWFGFALMSEFVEESKTKGKIDIATIPHGPRGEAVSLNVYWLYTIGTGSSKKDVAYDFIKFAVNAANDKLLTLEGGTGCRLSTWKDRDVNEMVPYYYRLKTLHDKAKELPRRKDWSKIADVIDEVVLEVINTDKPISGILEKSQTEINKLIN